MNLETDASKTSEAGDTFGPVPMPMALSTALWICYLATLFVVIALALLSGVFNLLSFILLVVLWLGLRSAHSILYGNRSASSIFMSCSLIGFGFFAHQFMQLFRTHPDPVSFILFDLHWISTVSIAFNSLFFLLTTVGFFMPGSLTWEGLPHGNFSFSCSLSLGDFFCPPVEDENTVRASDVIPSSTRWLIRLVYLLWLAGGALFLHAVWEMARANDQGSLSDFSPQHLVIQVVDAGTGEKIDATVQTEDPRISELPILFRSRQPTPQMFQRLHDFRGENAPPGEMRYWIHSRKPVRLYIVKKGYETGVVDVDPSDSSDQNIEVRLARELLGAE